MEEFIRATILGIGITILCNGPFIAIIIMLKKEIEKQEKKK